MADPWFLQRAVTAPGLSKAHFWSAEDQEAFAGIPTDSLRGLFPSPPRLEESFTGLGIQLNEDRHKLSCCIRVLITFPNSFHFRLCPRSFETFKKPYQGSAEDITQQYVPEVVVGIPHIRLSGHPRHSIIIMCCQSPIHSVLEIITNRPEGSTRTLECYLFSGATLNE
jgi:hypothetical protein